MRGVCVFLMVVILGAGLQALEVDRIELQRGAGRTIVFENFEGPPAKIETRDEIKGIGAYLAAAVGAQLTRRTYFDRYTIIRAVDPQVPTGLDADILIFDPLAVVDHIRNVRLILAGYLEAAYGYSAADAALLAEYTTIYNAVFRKDIEFFRAHYKPVVLRHLEPEKVGLALRYAEWPGNSQIVIPLSGAGRVPSAVEAVALSDPRVVEELRAREDMGLELRRDMVDLQERRIEDEQRALDESRLELERQRRESEAREAAAAEELRRAEEERRTAEQRVETARTEAERAAAVEDLREAERAREAAAERRDDVRDERTALEAEEARVVAREQAIERQEEAVREQREAIVRDQQVVLERERVAAALPRTIVFFQVRGVASFGNLVLIDAESAAVMKSSANEFASRQSVRFAGGSVFVARTSFGNQLALMDLDTLQEKLRAREEVFPEGMLVAGDRDLYAVIRDGDLWYIGRYDQSLTLTARSRQAVNPHTFMAFSDERLYVQSPDGRIVPISLRDFGQ